MRTLKSNRSNDVEYQAPEEGEGEVVAVRCKLCGKPVGVLLPAEGNEFRAQIERQTKAAVHTACLENFRDRKTAKALLAHEQAQMSAWEGICPKEFRKPLVSKKKGYDKDLLDDVLKWKAGEIGLRIEGKSGLCKTRFMFKLLEREHQGGRKVGAWMHAELRALVTALAAGDQAGLNQFLNTVLKLDILFLDDLGKGRRTPASEEVIYAIIDGRSKLCRPVMFTSNLPLKEIIKTFGEDYQEPLLRRIEDKTTLIQFK